jgi:hypothetical protein
VVQSAAKPHSFIQLRRRTRLNSIALLPSHTTKCESRVARRQTDLRRRQQGGGPRAQQQVAGHGGARHPLLLPAQQRNGIRPHRHRAGRKGVRQAAGARARGDLLQQRFRRLACRGTSLRSRKVRLSML